MKVVSLVLLMVKVFFVRCSTEGYENLYLLEVDFPAAFGRLESADVSTIYNLIKTTTGVKDLFAVKQLGNAKLHAVLDVENDAVWSTLTDGLSQQGVTYSTLPLVSCGNFAKELKLNETHFNMNFTTAVSHFVDFMFLEHGETEEDYDANMKKYLERLEKIIAVHGWEIYCFRVTLDVPVRVVQFSNVPNSADFKMLATFRAAEWAQATLRVVHDLTR